MRLIYRLVSWSASVAVSGPNTNAAAPILYHPSATQAQAYATAAGSLAAAAPGAAPSRVRALWSNQATDRLRFGVAQGAAANAGAGRTGTGRRLGFSAHAGFAAHANIEFFGIWISSADQAPEDVAFDALASKYYPTIVL